MTNMNLSSLIAALDSTCRDALEDAAALCVSRGGHEIGIEDYLAKLLDSREMQALAAQFGLSVENLRQNLISRASDRASGRAAPVFSPLLIELLQEAYLLASLELGHNRVDVFTLVLALLANPSRYSAMRFFRELGKIPADSLKRLMAGLNEAAARQGGRASSGPAGEGCLQRYATDFTEEARQNRIDPVFARGPQIRQMIDILTRRRKNNPILVGDPGVGKTAVVEGLALQIVRGEVPDVLKGTRLVGLDMGRLQAGASVKGEFEKRLKGIIDEIKASPVPTILFIDEAHTLVGSGNAAGSGDGANLLKPALARGELRTVAATTWSEYKKYFEKDAALARRFQLVRLDQPGPEETVAILRGLVPSYEQAHHVYIRDDAVRAIAELSTRYISGRQQPDKAVDVLDTACARVRVSLGARPAVLSDLEEGLTGIRRELTALERDRSHGAATADAARHAALQGQVAELQKRIEDITDRWQREKSLVEALLAQREASYPGAAPAADVPAPAGDDEQEDAPAASAAPSQEELAARLKDAQGNAPLVFHEVTPQLVAEIVSEWTGIPLGKLAEDTAHRLSSLKDRLHQRIRGQDHALDRVEKAVLAARTGLNNPQAPTAIFLLVGPSGVGKTETALAIADEIYGGEEMLISINMSEFQEKHTISRLIGSPPGYVGYGEGGRLTEAVRRQPYSVVLFDEVEKAHPDVINLFYQVFDKGILADGEGREIDFRNTMIFLTSNLGSEIVAGLCADDVPPDPILLEKALRPALTQFFRPALLGRMTIVPYMSLRPEIMRELVGIKLARIAARLQAQHRMPLTWSDDVVHSIAASCTAVDTGARNIDHIINASLLPQIATALLGGMGRPGRHSGLHIDLDKEQGVFTCTPGAGDCTA